MNEESVFIDLDKEVDEKPSKKRNFQPMPRFGNHPITLHYVPYTELGKYGLRKKTISCGASSASSISKRAIPVPAAGPIRPLRAWWGSSRSSASAAIKAAAA